MTEEPGPTPFGTELHARRTAAKLSRAKLAELAGMSEPGIQRIERGYDRASGKPTVPFPQTVLRLAEALGWNTAEALKLAGHDPQDLPLKPQATDTPPDVVMFLWARLSPQQQDLMIALMRQFAERPDNRYRDDTPTPLFSNAPH